MMLNLNRDRIISVRESNFSKTGIINNFPISMALKSLKKSNKLKQFWIAIKETFYEYTAITKVNGMFYLSKNMTSGFSRVLWSVLPIIILIFGLIMVTLLYEKYLDSPTSMTIARPLTILKVPFPAITICHPQNVMDYKIHNFLNHM